MYRIDTVKFTEYVESCLNNDKNGQATTKELIKYLKDCFESEYLNKYNLKQYKTAKGCLIEWLSGLPSCVDIVFYYSDIIDIYKSLELDECFFDNLTEEQQGVELDKYFERVAVALNDIYREHYNVDLY